MLAVSTLCRWDGSQLNPPLSAGKTGVSRPFGWLTDTATSVCGVGNPVWGEASIYGDGLGSGLGETDLANPRRGIL